MNNRRVPLEKRKRTEISCDRCKARKQKCHRAAGSEACRHCQENGIDCVTTQPRKQRIYGSAESVGARLALLEGLVKDIIPGADVSNVDSIQALRNSISGEDSDRASLLERPKSSEIKSEDAELLLQDKQGQSQYIGPASSYFFQMKLRTLLGDNMRDKKFHLFGSNPAQQQDQESRLIVGDATSQLPEDLSNLDDITNLGHDVLDHLVSAFFDKIHIDFPVFHEASFRETYEGWISSRSKLDGPFLCSLLCVLLLGRRAADFLLTPELEEKWCTRIQALLPPVLFTSNVSSVQALMLAAFHFHNSKRRDACWTLTGAAIRIALGIGLHKDNIKTTDTPLIRELRKQLWWTLYGFEQMQVSSHDRPSAIESASFSAGCPREAILDMGGRRPPDFMLWSNKLLLLLGLACQVKSSIRAGDTQDEPKSKAAALLKDLQRWEASLPAHFHLTVLSSLPAVFRRPTLLLHIQYHYTISLMTRSALLSRVSKLSKGKGEDIAAPKLELSDHCVASGQISCQLLLQLDNNDMFNAVAWWDIFYLYSAALVVLLSFICETMLGKTQRAAESRKLLRNMVAIAAKHLANTMMPGTMRLWASIVADLDKMAETFFCRSQLHHHFHQPGDVLLQTIPSTAIEQAPNVGFEQAKRVAYTLSPNVDGMMPSQEADGFLINAPEGTGTWSQPSSVEPDTSQFWQVDWGDFGDMMFDNEQWNFWEVS